MTQGDRYQLEVMADRTVVIHDTQTGHVVDSFPGTGALQEAGAVRLELEQQASDEHLWEWISE